MPIIIDGWNLLRDAKSDIDDSETGSLESAEALVSYLERFQAAHSDPIVLVFDSASEFLDIRRAGSAKLRIVPAKNADDYIKRYIDRTPERQRRNLRVVSSDNGIFYYAKSAYATPVKAGEFWIKLRGEGHVSRRSRQ